jgi:hypothetical protein
MIGYSKISQRMTDLKKHKKEGLKGALSKR